MSHRENKVMAWSLRIYRVLLAIYPETFLQEFETHLTLAFQDLLRHRIPDGNIATVMETALDLLIEQVTKERFAVGRKPRSKPAVPAAPADDTTPAEPDAPKPR